MTEREKLLESLLSDLQAHCSKRITRLELEREEWKAKATQAADKASSAEKRLTAAEQKRDEARAERDAYKRAKEENDERFLRERDEARAEVERLREALSLAEVEISLERSWCRACRTEGRGAYRGRAEHPHERCCPLYRATPLVTEDAK